MDRQLYRRGEGEARESLQAADLKTRYGIWIRRMAAGATITMLAMMLAMEAQAQTCDATPPGMDVLLFLDNSGSINNEEFDAAQQAVAGIASSLLRRPGYRLAVVNWACNGDNFDGCRLNLATGRSISGGWSSNPADFAYVGYDSSLNKVCRSFSHSDSCGGPEFTVRVSGDHAQHAFKMLDAVLFGGGATGGVDGYGDPTVAPSRPVQRLTVIHLTDGEDINNGWDVGSSMSYLPTYESALGRYYYSNSLKNDRNAIIIGVGIAEVAQSSLAAVSSKGGSSTVYDATHASESSTRAYDVGTPRLATFSTNFDAASILAAAESAITSAAPVCIVVRKQSAGGTGSFAFADGTNGMPANLTLDTGMQNPATSVHTAAAFLTDTSIREVIPSGWTLTSIACTDKNGADVAVTSNLVTGQLTIPGSRIVSGTELTCTFTNTSLQFDISVVKTVFPTGAVASGSVLTYTLTATNSGPSATTDVLLRDTPSAGLDCTTPSPTATCSASGGASCPGATVPVSTLTSGGVAIPSVPVGGQVAVTMQCTVTATGR